MSLNLTTRPDGRKTLTVELDDATLAWLIEVADMHHAEPAVIAASILRDIRQDDQDAHLQETMKPALRVVGGTDVLN